MNPISSPSRDERNDPYSPKSNPSLLTAGLPSSSIMTNPSPNVKAHLHYSFNQNQTTTEPYQSNRCDQDQTSDDTTGSHQTTSSAYLTLSRKDIRDVIKALKTLACCVQDHRQLMSDDSSPGEEIFSNKSSDFPEKHPSPNHRRQSMRRDRSRHHPRVYLPTSDFHPPSSYRWVHPEENYHHHLSHPNSYPSHSSNAMLHGSTYESDRCPRMIYQTSCSDCQSTRKRTCHRTDQYHRHSSSIKDRQFASSVPLSSYVLDQMIAIDRDESVSNLRILPQQATTFEILQTNPMYSLMSIDSLNFEDRSSHARTTDHVDVATQWSVQMPVPKETPIADSTPMKSRGEKSKSIGVGRDPTILTELSQSATTIVSHHSTTVATPTHVQTDRRDTSTTKSSVPQLEDDFELTKSETERFLTKLDLPTCRCEKQNFPSTEKNSFDDHITCLSFDNDSSVAHITRKTKRRTRRAKKVQRRQGRRRFSRAPTAAQPLEESSMDLFDMETSFFDSYDRFFTDPSSISDQ